MTPTQILSNAVPEQPFKRNVELRQELVAQVCERVAAGEPLTSVLRDEALPSWSQWWTWVTRYPDVARAYAEARERMAHALFSRVIEVANATLAGKYDAKAANIAIGAYQWAAGKLAPKHYSDRHQATEGVQLVIQTTLNLDGDPGRGQDLSDGSSTYTLVAQPAREEEPPAEPHRLPAEARGSQRGSRRRTRKNHTSRQVPDPTVKYDEE